MRLGLAAVAVCLLAGCGNDAEDRQAYFEMRDARIQHWMPANIHAVCVKGITYYYLDAGNGASMSVALGTDSKVIPCEVKHE